jgi:hypothetical protein
MLLDILLIKPQLLIAALLFYLLGCGVIRK